MQPVGGAAAARADLGGPMALEIESIDPGSPGTRFCTTRRKLNLPTYIRHLLS
jgi:hypothetical protein